MGNAGSPDDRPADGASTFLLDVHGQLDLGTAAKLCREIDAVSGPQTRIVVDLGDVTSCDAHGMRALIGAAQEATVRLSKLVIAVKARSALDRLITRAGAREFVRVVYLPGDAIAASARRRAVSISR